jgi:hypothetical protein
MRHLGLDVHQTFCEVAIREAGRTWSAGRVATDREALELFARSLDPRDEVAMEVTGPAMEIARILAPTWRRSSSPTPRTCGRSPMPG